jgi:tetratricopeptide (TPR) repeat protein
MAVSTKKRKKQASRRNKRALKGKQSTEKGALLEQIAARMYSSPFHKVTPNAKVPPINRDPKRKQEIDVLLEGKVVTRPPRRAIECKNLGKKVGVGKIHEFVGKLADVGIPHEHGIYISPTGYTAGAVDRARPVNLQLLTLTGLTEDGLASITAKASQLKVFYLAQVQGITVTNNLGQIENAYELLIFFDANGNCCGTVADLIWNQWQAGVIPAKAGQYDINLTVPEGWKQIINGKEEPVLAIQTVVRVTAFVLKIPGESTYHTLIRASDGKIEKRQLNTTFNVEVDQTTVHTLDAFGTEAELLSAIHALTGVRLTIRTRLPRIQYLNRFYYPISPRVVQLLRKRGEDASEPEQSADDLNIDEIEGTDLRAVFEPFTDAYPRSLGPVIVYDGSQGKAVDVSGLLRAGEHERVCQLEKHFRKQPRLEFAEVLHTANLIHAGKLLDATARLPRDKALRLADRARRKVLKALQFKPDSPGAYHNLGIVLQELGRHSEAVVSFDNALTLAPGQLSTLILKGQSLRSLARFEEALTTYEEVLSLQSDHLEALYYRSGILGMLGRFKESIEGYEAVLNTAPTHYESLYCRGLSQFHLELYKDAINSFSDALRARPDELDPLIYRATAFERAGRNKEALGDYTTVLSNDLSKDELLINRGSVLRLLGRYEEALADFDRGLHHHDDNAIGWNNRGATLDNLDRPEEALASYEKAIEVDPLNRMALTNCGISLSNLGRLKDALGSFDAALTIEPQDVGTLHSKGLALYRLGRFDEALEIYDRVLELRPDAYDTLANKALVLAELNRSDEAFETASRALDLSPQTNDRSMLFAIRAKISYPMSRFAHVVADMVEAWKVNPDLVLALKESHTPFVESFNALRSVTDEETKLYAALATVATKRLDCGQLSTVGPEFRRS